MICEECINGNPTDCWGLTKDKTWCDSQHMEVARLDPTKCSHINFQHVYPICPNCSKAIPLTMTKKQAIALLMDFFVAIKKADGHEECKDTYNSFSERILNDRPTRDAEDSEASVSAL